MRQGRRPSASGLLEAGAPGPADSSTMAKEEVERLKTLTGNLENELKAKGEICIFLFSRVIIELSANFVLRVVKRKSELGLG